MFIRVGNLCKGVRGACVRARARGRRNNTGAGQEFLASFQKKRRWEVRWNWVRGISADMCVAKRDRGESESEKEMKEERQKVRKKAAVGLCVLWQARAREGACVCVCIYICVGGKVMAAVHICVCVCALECVWVWCVWVWPESWGHRWGSQPRRRRKCSRFLPVYVYNLYIVTMQYTQTRICNHAATHYTTFWPHTAKHCKALQHRTPLNDILRHTAMQTHTLQQ